MVPPCVGEYADELAERGVLLIVVTVLLGVALALGVALVLVAIGEPLPLHVASGS